MAADTSGLPALAPAVMASRVTAGLRLPERGSVLLSGCRSWRRRTDRVRGELLLSAVATVPVSIAPLYFKNLYKFSKMISYFKKLVEVFELKRSGGYL